MEKVNEVGRFKQRSRDYFYSLDTFKNFFHLDLSLIRSYRFDYIISKEDLSMFLNYVGYLAIPELGVNNCKIKIVKHGEELRCIYLTVNGEKKDVDNIDIMLKRLRVGLNKTKG